MCSCVSYITLYCWHIMLLRVAIGRSFTQWSAKRASSEFETRIRRWKFFSKRSHEARRSTSAEGKRNLRSRFFPRPGCLTSPLPRRRVESSLLSCTHNPINTSIVQRYSDAKRQTPCSAHPRPHKLHQWLYVQSIVPRGIGEEFRPNCLLPYVLQLDERFIAITQNSGILCINGKTYTGVKSTDFTEICELGQGTCGRVTMCEYKVLHLFLRLGADDRWQKVCLSITQ